jgi:hypothetical protein
LGPALTRSTLAYRLSSIAIRPITNTTNAMPNNVISIKTMTLTLYLPSWDLCALSTPQRMLAAKGPGPFFGMSRP